MPETPTATPTISEALSWPMIFNGEHAPSYVREIRSSDVTPKPGSPLSEEINEDAIVAATVIERQGKQVLYRLVSDKEILVTYK